MWVLFKFNICTLKIDMSADEFYSSTEFSIVILVSILVSYARLTKNDEVCPNCFGAKTPVPQPPPKLEPGSAYIVPWINIHPTLQMPPWHSFYALTPDTFFNIVNLRAQTATFLLFENTDLKFVPKKVTTCRETIKAKIGIALAYRMLDREYPYHLHRCNCRHYTDYLLYGRTFGEWWNLSYMPISMDCPLHGRLTSDTDVNSPDYKLYDKLNRPYELDAYPPALPSLPSGSFTSSESDSSSHSFSPVTSVSSSSDQSHFSIKSKHPSAFFPRLHSFSSAIGSSNYDDRLGDDHDYDVTIKRKMEKELKKSLSRVTFKRHSKGKL